MRRALVLVLIVAGCGLSPEAARKALASPDAAERQKAATALQATDEKDPQREGHDVT